MERTQTRPVTPRTAVVWAVLRPEIEGRDRLTVLDQGKVLASGTVAQIQANKNVQEIYLRRA